MDTDKAAETTRLHEENEDPAVKDVIRVASYHRLDYDLAVIRTFPRPHHLIRDLLTPKTLIIDLNSRLGVLDVFPLEFIHEICLMLDVQSLFRFHRVNRRARQIASASGYYKAVVKHAIGALFVILRTGMASWYKLSDLYDVLCTKNCAICNDFGGFIFLPSFMRCCFFCIEDDELPPVLPASQVRPYLNRRSAPPLSSRIPMIKTLPGIYSLDESKRTRRFELVLEQSAISLFSSDRVPTFPKKYSRDTELQRYMVSTALPYLDNKNDVIEKGVSCSGCQISLEKALQSSGAEYDVWDDRDKIYSHDQFMEHFETCPEARKLWELSEGGTIEPDIPAEPISSPPLNEDTTVIAKVARFEWEIPRLSQETSIYKQLQDTGLAPRFFGHVHEHGRVIGFILERLKGREAGIKDLPLCQSVLKRLHDIGILHGDVNRYNFIVRGDAVRLIDFERSQQSKGATTLMHAEMESLCEQLLEDTGRGAGFTRSNQQIE
ncbi:hypothetical protein CBS147323_2054 [Aspergillus niger]|nr:hypothetical protein CBS147323_2054 [Aspergillus niger]KAI3032000.1 hypothetical protein CBS147347_1661 [Aspergillus niger]